MSGTAADGDGIDEGRAPVVTPARVFGVLVVLAIPVILYQGRNQWFYFDDWYFLRPIETQDTGDLMEPYWGHWTLVPRVLHGTLFSAFGLQGYGPYQALVVGTHVGTAILLRLVMVRAQVDRWIASALATGFLFFGAGRDNMVWAFQISMTGSLVLGLAQLLLADHDGPFDRRSALAVVAGTVAVACSNVGLVVLVATALALGWRRGIRVAAVQVVPPALVFGVWWVSTGRHGSLPVDLSADSTSQAVDYAANLLRVLVGELGPGPTGPIVVAAMVAGCALAGRAALQGKPREWAGPMGLLAAGAVFLVMTAGTRAGGQSLGALAPDAAPSRYLHVLAALTLPMLGVVSSEVARRFRAVPVAAILWVAVIAGLPSNLAAIAEPADPSVLGKPTEVLVAAEVAASFEEVQADRPASLAVLHPLGWLVEQVERGRMPAAPPGHPEVRGRAFAQVVFQPVPPSVLEPCGEFDPSVPIALEVGDVVGARAEPGSLVTISTVTGLDLRTAFTVGPSGELALRVVAGPLSVTMVPSDPAAGPPLHCT